MHTDPRGGHNKKLIDHNFFKTWSKNDGAVEDCRISSRTCYISIGINDYDLLVKIRKSLSSDHNIYIKKGTSKVFPDGKTEG
jgi:hypothetical protein